MEKRNISNSAFRRFVELNQRASAAFDRLLPEQLRVDGNRYFKEVFAPEYLKNGLLIYDIGSGRTPFVDSNTKKTQDLTIVGVDIDKTELASAPQGIYDKVICADILEFKGNNDADLVICQAILEHVRDVDKAFAAISSIAKQCGAIIIFVPCKNAVFARLNLIIPQKSKKFMLHAIFPQTKDTQGFVSYYDKCTPREFKMLASRHGFVLEKCSIHFISSYFSFLFPVYVLWRIWIIVFKTLYREQAAESFCMALRRIG
jgi:2-polyprenyl-6-hydroxyphenyl methylase/3-demethylubiquinone-9 3-methyltransferase